MSKFTEYLENKKPILEKSIFCSNIDNFEKVLKKLSSIGYKDGRPGQFGAKLNPIPLSKFNWEHGYRAINLYSNKTINFALKSPANFKIIKDIDFLK